MGIDVGEELFLGGVGDVVTERFGEELVRGGEVLLAVTEEHAGPVVERGPSRLGDQCRLAQAGLAGDEQRPPPLAAATRLTASADGRHLGLPTDHAHGGAHGQAAGQRDGVGVRTPDGSHRTSTVSTGSGRPFRVSSPSGRHSWRLRRPAMARTKSVARIWPALAAGAQPGRLDDGVPEVVVRPRR